jgi:hypothetical protein
MPLAKPRRLPAGHWRRSKVLMQDRLAEEQLLRVAEAARYVSSPYHRAPRSPFGPPVARPYPHASKCPSIWEAATATRALREAIRSGCVSTEWRGGFPRFAWYMRDETVYEAVLSNRENGEYHGYPLESRNEWPKGL